MDPEEINKLSPSAKAIFEMSVEGKDEQKPKVGTDIMSAFENERKLWSGDIRNLAERMRDIGKLIDVQVDLFTFRQRCVERKHELLIDLNKYNKKHKTMLAQRLAHYHTNYDRKLTGPEKERMIDGDVADLKYWLDTIEDQVNFFDQVFKNIDNMIFGIKHRIELEDYLRKQ